MKRLVLLERGVNYIDTGESYNQGHNEILIGKAIKEFDRKSLFITTKLVLKKGTEKKEEILKRARKCLERLKTDYIDCLMIHGVFSKKEFKNEGFHLAAKQLKNEGRLRFSGISCHGASWAQNPEETMEEVLGAAIEDGRFDVMLLVYSFLNQEKGQRILKACREKNIGTTLMKTNPFTGGYVFWMGEIEKYEKEGGKLTEWQLEIRRKFKERQANAEPFIKKYNLNNKAEIRDAAIRFVLSNQDVSSVVITFMNFEDIEDYLRLSGSRFTVLDKKKLIAYSMANGNLYCRHACGICESQCPHEIPVNTIMRYNHYFVAQGQQKYAIEKYAKMEGPKAVSCETCRGFCSTQCPYGVPIQSLLNLAHLNLTLA